MYVDRSCLKRGRASNTEQPGKRSYIDVSAADAQTTPGAALPRMSARPAMAAEAVVARTGHDHAAPPPVVQRAVDASTDVENVLIRNRVWRPAQS